jgi:hypothetical protein
MILGTRWMVMSSLLASGCVGGATDAQLQARAAADLDCAPEAIANLCIDGETRIANGCGKQALYVETCAHTHHTGCTWMLNSAVRPSTAAPKTGHPCVYYFGGAG